MKILKTILFILLGLAVIYLVTCFLGPKKLDTTRSMTMDAPAMLIHDQVNNLQNWEAWSPWAKMDPEMKIEYGERYIGVGGSYSWESEEMGGGNLEIMESSENAIKTKLTFENWEGNSYGNWKFEDAGEGKTNVSWGMTTDSELPLLLRGMMFITGAKGKMESDFDSGLSAIKSHVEELANSFDEVEIISSVAEERHFIGNRSKISLANISKYYEENFPALMESMGKAGIEMAGMPGAIFYDWNPYEAMTDLAAVIPVGEGAMLEGYESLTIEPGKVLVVDHFGPYNSTPNAHFAMDAHMRTNGIEYKGPVLEEYLNDPSTVTEDKIHTRITYYVN